MRIASIASAVLALGISAAVPSMAKADHFRGRDYDRRYDDRRVIVERRVIERPVYRDSYRDSYRESYRDIDVNVSLRDVPSSVLNTLDCERHGEVETIQFVRRDGQEFYRFGVNERRGAQTVIRIGSNGRLLTIGQQEACDPGYAVYRR
jgi:hypothetical protein